MGRHVHFVNGKRIQLGKGVKIRPDVDMFASELLFVGANCDIGTRNRIVGNVVIEDDVLMGPDNYICSVDHCYQNINVPIMHQGTYCPKRNGHKELRIGEGSWIGTHAAIIGDVHIGKHCIVGANSVVLKDIPDYCVVVGSPARIVKTWSNEIKEWKSVIDEEMPE